MDRERKNAGCPLKEAPNGFSSFEPAERWAFPEGVFGKKGGDAVRVVLGVAQGGVTRLEVTDRLGVFQSLKAPFDLFEPGQGMTRVPA